MTLVITQASKEYYFKMDNYKNFVERLPNKELELLLLAIFKDKVRRKKLKLEGVPKSKWHLP